MIRNSLALALCAAALPALAQHPDSTHAHHPAPPDAMGTAHATGHPAHAMTSATAPAAPMSRDGSGTAWLPDASPMEAVHGAAGGWSLMLHGAAFPRYTAQDAFGSGGRGDARFGAPNWAMGMAQRPLGAGTRLTLRLMASLDAAVEGGRGYPLLFQSGETFDGERLVDRQHPHDLVSELSATVARRLGDGVSAFAYAAYPGEPALGPAAFMHRPSARFSPDSPLSHHWQDATHIAWGVATAGLVVGPVKLDGSVFTGREPDENRVVPDAPRFDSYSGRVTVNPTARLSLQASAARLREPEAAEPGVDQTRVTASALYAAPLGGGDLTSALVWGMNRVGEGGHHEGGHGGGAEAAGVDDGHAGTYHSVLGETALRLRRAAVFGRAEWVEKGGEEIGLEGALGELTHRVSSASLGAGYEVARPAGLSLLLGGQATAYAVPSALRPLYGDAPVSLQVFLRVSPR